MTVSRHLSYMALPVLFLCCAFARAESRCVATVASVVSIQGNVDIRGKDTEAWRPITADEGLCAGDSVSVRRYSRALLRLELEQTNIQLGEGTTLTLPGTKDGAFSVVELLKGITHFISRVPHALKIKTPFVNAAVEGTEFIVKVDEQQTLVSVTEGHVNADNAAGQLTLQSGQSAMTIRGAAPGAYTVTDTMGAVQWALYYPHVFEFEPKDISNFGLEPWRAIVADSVRALRANDLRTALTLLEQAGEDISSKNYLLYRAHLFLKVGRVAEAQEDIERVLDIDATSSVAWVMRAVIAVTQGRAKAALEAAQKAVQADANSAPAQLALSYAYQAQFDLDNALTAALAATRLDEDSSLAWARLAELHLMHGRLDETLEAAQRAEKLNPNSAQAKTVLGYAYLVQYKFESASLALNSAAHFDPGSPLPRLGLGLVKIRQGDLAGGRAQLEIATSLDPRNSLLRSYVGKAYYEENRDKLASEQFAQAKVLDPNDPTPWFYDAILKQAQNRPVDALRAMQKSIDLNDNRAVYRSRLLLDDDLAARSASQGRIYRDLGFEADALAQGWESLSLDPRNFSAHRLLADSYAVLPRHEIARASELLQSQMMQPLNLAPLQPQLAQTDLPFYYGVGPSAAGYGEFNPLFTRDGLYVRLNGMVGSNETVGDDLVVSGLYKRVSYNIAQYHYETEGFRPNNDLTQNAYSVFLQAQPTVRSSLQLELRQQDRNNGDLALLFDPDIFSLNRRDERSDDTARLGYHFAPSASSDLLVSVISSKTKVDHDISEVVGELFPGEPVVRDEQTRTTTKRQTVETQWLTRTSNVNYVAGVGYHDEEGERTGQAVESALGEVLYADPRDLSFATQHSNAYVYSYLHPVDPVAVTLGLSIDRMDASLGHVQLYKKQMNPKLGVLWEVMPGTRLRLAAFRAFKRTLASNQTLEPTHITGFNQFFDDVLGTDSTRYGVGVDQAITRHVAAGLEITRRKLVVPFPDTLAGDVFDEDQRQRADRVYLHWLLGARMGLAVGYHNERFERDAQSWWRAAPNLRTPDRLVTQSVPVTFSYFHPGGGFGKVRATYVAQELEGSAVELGQDQFWVCDLSTGYRLPQRYGMLSLDIKNAFDAGVNFHNVDFQSGTVPRGLYQPGRSVYLRFSLGL